MSDLVMQKRVNGQYGTLQQPGFKVRWHARLSREHRFQPETRSVSPDRLSEVVAFGMRGFDRFRQGDRDRLLYPNGLRLRHRLLARRLRLHQRADALSLALAERGPQALIEAAVRRAETGRTGERDRCGVKARRNGRRRALAVRIPWPGIKRKLPGLEDAGLLRTWTGVAVLADGITRAGGQLARLARRWLALPRIALPRMVQAWMALPRIALPRSGLALPLAGLPRTVLALAVLVLASQALAVLVLAREARLALLTCEVLIGLCLTGSLAQLAWLAWLARLA